MMKERDRSMQGDIGIYLLFCVALRLVRFLSTLEMRPAWEKKIQKQYILKF